MNFTDRVILYFKKFPVTAVLLTLNTLMLFVVLLNGGFGIGSLVRNGGLVPILVTQEKEYWRLLTSMFLHGSFFHFFFNTYFLYFFGRFTEQLIGSLRYSIVYLVSGLGASVAVWLLGNPFVVTVGASGALYGIMGGLVVLTYIKSHWFSYQGIRSIRMIAILNVGLTVFSLMTDGSISFLGHVGGLVFGIILTYLIIPKRPALKNYGHYGPPSDDRIIIDMDDVSDDDIYEP